MSYQQIAPYSGHSSTESTPSPHSAPRALPFTTPGASSSKPKPPTRSIPAPPSSPSSSSMLQITPAPRHTHTHSHTQSLSAPSRRSHEEESHAGGAAFLPSVPLADLFAPHSDGRHCVCRVCKAMLSGTMSAMRGHLMVFHKAGDAQF